MDSSVRRLHPLLRLAAISGVETAVKLHIRRGDDLDACDGVGATPLILAAAKKKKGVVKLLLDAGADPTLVDFGGRSALAHACAAGCPETVALLTEALARLSESESRGTESADLMRYAEHARTAPQIAEESTMLAWAAESFMRNEVPSIALLEKEAQESRTKLEPCSRESSDRIPVVEAAPVSSRASEIFALDDEPLDADFEETWEAEVDAPVPLGDESVAEAARKVHERIGQHRATDCDEDWGDVDLHLPERAAPLEREDGDGTVRALLLVALREGMVSEAALAEVCSNADGTRNEEAERLLSVVVGELGATIVEWTGVDGVPVSEPSPEEERLIDEATEFANELASGHNDPFRFYSKEMRGKLLDAEEEIALSREMEEAARSALAALARWHQGLAELFDAADQVARGDADAGFFGTGSESEAEESVAALVADEDEDGEDVTPREGGAAAFLAAVEGVRAAGQDVQRVGRLLESIRLTRGFLGQLERLAAQDPDGEDFAKALRRQSAARERMIRCNLRLALSIAKKYLRSGVPFDDLVQEANIGLMKAVERYDWRKGFRFSTYATWWIRQQVTRSIADTARIVRAPVHIQDTARKVLRERDEVEDWLGRAETEVETAHRIGISVAKTTRLLSLFEDSYSLDEIDPNTGLSRAESLVDLNGVDPAEPAERASLHLALMGMLEELDERSREVILLRFGFGGEDAKTLEEVGQHFGVTRERIRQIESKAMRKLSNERRRSIVAPFMGDAYVSGSGSAGKASSSTESLFGTVFQSSPSGGRGMDACVNASARPEPSFSPPRQRVVRPVAERPEPVRELLSETRSSVQAPRISPDFAGNLASRLGEEARKLGLRVEDRRAEGGELRIAAPYDSTPEVRTLGRRLLVAGFRKDQGDVFVK